MVVCSTWQKIAAWAPVSRAATAVLVVGRCPVTALVGGIDPLEFGKLSPREGQVQLQPVCRSLYNRVLLSLDFLGGCGWDSADDAGPLASEPVEI